MDAGYVLPVLLLALVLFGAAGVLLADERQKRLRDRVTEALHLGGEQEVVPSTVRGIRLPRVRGGSLRQMPARMMRVPLDLPLAHKIPVWLVLVLGIVAGLASGSFMHYFVRPSIAFVLGMAAGIFVSRFIFNWEFSRYQTALFKQLPDALELVISSTRAGLPLTEAFRAVNREMPSPTKEEFTRLTNEMTLGIAADQALMSMSARTQVNEYAIFAATVAIQLRSGGRIGESIANLSETIRQRVAMAGRAKALSAEARLSAQIMAVLPFVGGGMMSVINPGYLAPLFADPRGKTMFLIGGGLLLTGILALRQLVNGVASE